MCESVPPVSLSQTSQPVEDFQAAVSWADCPPHSHPPTSSCSPRAADIALLQPNETVFDVHTLFEPHWEAKFKFVALVSTGPSSHNPTGNLLLPMTPEKPYLPTSNGHQTGEALLTEHAGVSMLFRIVLIPPLSRASPNSPSIFKESQLLPGRPRFRGNTVAIKLWTNGGSEQP